MRLARFLSLAGIASRRKAEEFITAGRVKVNGKVRRDLAKPVDPQKDTVEFDGRALRADEKVYYKVHKPVGYVSTVRDRHAEKCVVDLVPKMPRVFPIGRLDKDSSGLLLLTNDGDLAYELTHPKFAHTKVYVVTVQERIRPIIPEKLCAGIRLREEVVRADAAEIIAPHQLRITLHEGKNHQIRRMLNALRLTVQSLVRVQEGKIHLGTLAPGAYAALTRNAIL